MYKINQYTHSYPALLMNVDGCMLAAIIRNYYRVLLTKYVSYSNGYVECNKTVSV